jgi:putative redox protein
MGTITIRGIEDKMMAASDSNGHSIVVGRSPDPDFEYLGVKPSDLLLMAAGACTAYDIVDILKKQRQNMRDIEIKCTGEQKKEPPYTFTKIHLHYIIYGDVDSEKLERAIDLSENKYCSVLSTLKPALKISSDYEIKE